MKIIFIMVIFMLHFTSNLSINIFFTNYLHNYHKKVMYFENLTNQHRCNKTIYFFPFFTFLTYYMNGLSLSRIIKFRRYGLVTIKEFDDKRQLTKRLSCYSSWMRRRYMRNAINNKNTMQ